MPRSQGWAWPSGRWRRAAANGPTIPAEPGRRNRDAATNGLPLGRRACRRGHRSGHLSRARDRELGAAKRAGTEGATIVRGRGTGVHEGARFQGPPIEP